MRAGSGEGGREAHAAGSAATRVGPGEAVEAWQRLVVGLAPRPQPRDVRTAVAFVREAAPRGARPDHYLAVALLLLDLGPAANRCLLEIHAYTHLDARGWGPARLSAFRRRFEAWESARPQPAERDRASDPADIGRYVGTLPAAERSDARLLLGLLDRWLTCRSGRSPWRFGDLDPERFVADAIGAGPGEAAFNRALLHRTAAFYEWLAAEGRVEPEVGRDLARGVRTLALGLVAAVGRS